MSVTKYFVVKASDWNVIYFVCDTYAEAYEFKQYVYTGGELVYILTAEVSTGLGMEY